MRADWCNLNKIPVLILKSLIQYIMGTVVSRGKQQLEKQRKEEILKSIQERNQNKKESVQVNDSVQEQVVSEPLEDAANLLQQTAEDKAELQAMNDVAEKPVDGNQANDESLDIESQPNDLLEDDKQLENPEIAKPVTDGQQEGNVQADENVPQEGLINDNVEEVPATAENQVEQSKDESEIDESKDKQPPVNKENITQPDNQDIASAENALPHFDASKKYGKAANPEMTYLENDEILPEGTRITHNNSTYTVIEKIGAGSFAITYLMRDGEGKLCVMKEFHPDRTLRLADYSLDYSRCVPVRRPNLQRDDEYERAKFKFNELKKKFEKEPERVRGFLKRGKKAATRVTDSMSYQTAFNTARQEVGAGGSFVWHNETYSTYTEEEIRELNISLPKTDCFQIGAGLYFLMENIAGTTLTDFMHRGRNRGGDTPMTFELAMQIMEQLCEAVKTIHEIPCAHMDINPNNIMVLVDDVPMANGRMKKVLRKLKIIDFGMATYAKDITNEMARDAFQERVNGSYVPGGTRGFTDALTKRFEYIEPDERMKIEDKLLLIDIYSLGSILYYLLLLDYEHSWENAQDKLVSNLSRMSHHNDGNILEKFTVKQGDTIERIEQKRKYQACYELVRKATNEDFFKRLRKARDFLKEIQQIQAEIRWEGNDASKETKEFNVEADCKDLKLSFKHNYKCVVHKTNENINWIHLRTSLIKVSEDAGEQLLKTKIPGKVEISLKPNENTKPRSASITIFCGKQRVNATIIQAGKKVVKPDVFFPIGTQALSKIEAKGGTDQIRFTATATWEAFTVFQSTDWIKLSDKEGAAGNVTLTIQADENPYEQEREATIKILCGEKVIEWAVRQAPKPFTFIRFEKETRQVAEVPSAGGLLSFVFDCNAAWYTALQPIEAADWLELKQKGIAGLQSFHITVKPNQTTMERNAVITLLCDSQKIEYTINQDKAVIKEEPVSVTGQPEIVNEQPTNATGQKKPETVTGKPVTADTSEETVITKPEKVTPDQIEFTDRRTLPTNFTSAGGKESVKFMTTKDWTAEIIADQKDWLSLSANKGKGGVHQTIQITAKANPTYQEREAVLRIHCGNQQEDWHIQQNPKAIEIKFDDDGKKKNYKNLIFGSLATLITGAAAYFLLGGGEVTPPSGPLSFPDGQKYELTYKGGNIAIPVESPGLWKAEIAEQSPEGWLQIQEGSGKAGKGKFGLKADVNRKWQPRKATIVLTSGDQKLRAKVVQGIDRADSLNHVVVNAIKNPIDIIKFLKYTKRVVTVYECFEEGGKKYTDGVPDFNTLLSKKNSDYIIGVTHDIIEFTQDKDGKIDTLVLLKK